MTHQPIIIPQQNHGLIAEITDNNVNIVAKFDIPYRSISKVIDNETIVTLDKSEKQLLLHNIDGTLLKSIDVPFGITMNVKDHVIYIGGDASDGEVCYMLDLKNDEFTLKNIQLPKPMSHGKAVDDILILENKMLLLDNIVLPKFTFEYDISVPNKPKWVETIELPRGRTYENIIKGDMNADWMIYFSTSSHGLVGDGTHITAEGKKDISLSLQGRYFTKPYFSFKDICLIGDTLYVLTDIGYYPYEFSSPFAAYLVPPDIEVGEKVVLEDLIEDHIGRIHQSDVYRVQNTEAEWDGKKFVIIHGGNHSVCAMG